LPSERFRRRFVAKVLVLLHNALPTRWVAIVLGRTLAMYPGSVLGRAAAYLKSSPDGDDLDEDNMPGLVDDLSDLDKDEPFEVEPFDEDNSEAYDNNEDEPFGEEAFDEDEPFDEEPFDEDGPFDEPGDAAAEVTCEMPAGGAAALGALFLGQSSRAPRVDFIDDEKDWVLRVNVYGGAEAGGRTLQQPRQRPPCEQCGQQRPDRAH
jgi:hypothetical protein